MPRRSSRSAPAAISRALPWFAISKQRGLLDETIVIWTGEFGRLPVSQGTDGRDHNRHGFSLWLAGGGFKAGYVHGATDDFGYKSVENIVTVHDLAGHTPPCAGPRPSQADLPPRRAARQLDRRRGDQGQGRSRAAFVSHQAHDSRILVGIEIGNWGKLTLR